MPCLQPRVRIHLLHRQQPPRHRKVYLTAVLIGLLCVPLLGPAQAGATNQTPLNPAARSFVSVDRRIEHRVLNSAALGYEESYAVELPASYHQDKTRHYPVMFFLHGQFGNENDWERNGLSELLETMEASHEIQEMIVVLPNGRSSFFINSFDGKSRYGDFIVKELIPTIDADYRTVPRREGRAIMGVSMGGFGALTLAMQHPDLFSAVATHSAAVLEEIPQPSTTDRRMQYRLQLATRVFGNPIDTDFWAHNNPILLSASLEKRPLLKIYFDCGDHDRFGFNVGADALDKALKAHHIAHEFHIEPGDHGWEFARQQAPHSLKFVSDALKGAVASAAGRRTPALR